MRRSIARLYRLIAQNATYFGQIAKIKSGKCNEIALLIYSEGLIWTQTTLVTNALTNTSLVLCKAWGQRANVGGVLVGQITRPQHSIEKLDMTLRPLRACFTAMCLSNRDAVNNIRLDKRLQGTLR